MLSQTTCSTLLTRSKFVESPILPCRSWPFDALTIRSRSFCSIPPGGSLHTNVTFNEGERPVMPLRAAAPLRPVGTLTTIEPSSPCFRGPPSPNPPFGLGPGMITEPAKSTRPQPDELLGDGPASEGLYPPTS